ncbi:hypothetical protein ACFL2Y_03550, partial [Candidatus Omnitrophota bacterium]
IWSFITELWDNVRPTDATDLNPDGSTLVPPDINITWTGNDDNLDAGDSLTYDVSYRKAGDTSYDRVADRIRDSRYDTTPLDLNYTYTYDWQVDTYDYYNLTISTSWSFTIEDEPDNPPNVPITTGPEDNAIGVASVGIDLTWSGGDPDLPDDTLTYDVYFGTIDDDTLPHKLTITGAGDTGRASTGALLTNTTYQWQVEATDESGDKTLGPVWSFIAELWDNVIPTDATDLNPDGSIPVPPDINITWKGNDANLGQGDSLTYDVSYRKAGDTSFDRVANRIRDSRYDTTPLHLNNTETYDWQVDTYDYYNLTISTDWSFTTEIKNLAPNNLTYTVSNRDGSTNNALNRDGATGVALDIILQCYATDPNGDTLSYDLYFGEDSNPPIVDSFINMTKGISYDPALEYNTTYYWKVDAWDGDGLGILGPIWSFIAELWDNVGPTDATDLNPDGSIPVAPNINITWTGNDANIDDGDSLTYDVFYRKAGDPSYDQVANRIRDSRYDTTPLHLNYTDTYDWQVDTYDYYNETISTSWSFTIEDGPNSSPQVTSFDVQPRATTDSVFAIWEVTDDIAMDRVELLRAPDSAGSPGTWQQVQTESVLPPGASSAAGKFTDTPGNGTWWYRLRAVDAAGNIGYEPNPPGPIQVVSSPPSNWSSPVRLDSAEGAFPTLYYSPSGDLRAFYNIAGSPRKMVVRTRMNGSSVFGTEKYVYDNGREVGIHYAGVDNIDLAVATRYSAVVLKSTDNGNSWPFQEGYPATNRDANYNPLFFTPDGSNLRLIYGYEFWGAVMGSHTEVYSALRQSGTWDANGINIDNGTIRGAYENGNEVTIVTSRGVYYSSDNGLSYILNPDFSLKAKDMAIRTNDDRLYLLHTYTSGSSWPNIYKHLNFTYSDNHGATWRSSHIPINVNYTEYMTEPRFTVMGDTIVAIWLERLISPTSYIVFQDVKGRISRDGGQTWGPVETIVSLNGNQGIIGNHGWDPAGIDISSYNGKISLVYSVYEDGTGSRKGVYLMELDI